MNLDQIERYEIKTSKMGLKLPVVNDVHLHSIYNPEKEAQSIADKYEENIKSKKNILILGLGFGYHVNKVVEMAKKYHGEEFNIVVIEPNLKVTNDCRELKIVDESILTIHAGMPIQELYEMRSLVEFLTDKPTVIAHPSSFNLYRDYFKDFLSFEAKSDLFSCSRIITDTEISNYLESFGDFDSIESLIDNKILRQTELKDERDHVMLAYRHMLLSDF